MGVSHPFSVQHSPVYRVHRGLFTIIVGKKRVSQTSLRHNRSSSHTTPHIQLTLSTHFYQSINHVSSIHTSSIHCVILQLRWITVTLNNDWTIVFASIDELTSHQSLLMIQLASTLLVLTYFIHSSCHHTTCNIIRSWCDTCYVFIDVQSLDMILRSMWCSITRW